MLNESLKMYSVGQRYSEFRTGEDGYRLEYDGERLWLYVLLRNWLPKEQIEVSEKKRIVFHFAQFDGIGFFCVKFGDLPWGDAPFHPAIYKGSGIKYSERDFGERKGIPLTIVCADSASGELLYMRLVGLGNQFSKSWQKWLLCHADDDLNREEYERAVDGVYRYFSSEALAMIAPIRWALDV